MVPIVNIKKPYFFHCFSSSVLVENTQQIKNHLEFTMNTLQKFNLKQIDSLTKGKKIPQFKAGDTVKVNVRITEGANSRVQAFEGVCIARSNKGLHSNFTVRKISNGEGVERVFPLYSPILDSLQVIRIGDVRRAKLYYMRGLTGKRARIREKIEAIAPAAAAAAAEAPADTNSAA